MATARAGKDPKESSDYVTTPVPRVLMDRVDAVVASNDWGFRSRIEFIAVCIRDGLVKYPPKKE